MSKKHPNSRWCRGMNRYTDKDREELSRFRERQGYHRGARVNRVNVPRGG